VARLANPEHNLLRRGRKAAERFSPIHATGNTWLQVGKDQKRGAAMSDLIVERDLAFLKPECSYEIWQGDLCVAGSDSLGDALHYLMVYSQDGPAKLYRLIRQEVQL